MCKCADVPMCGCADVGCSPPPSRRGRWKNGEAFFPAGVVEVERSPYVRHPDCQNAAHFINRPSSEEEGNHRGLESAHSHIRKLKFMPFAARVSDMHTCPMVTGLVPHVGGPILPPGVVTVFIGGLPAATVGNMVVCVGPPDSIVKGSATVLINNKPAARMGDTTAHGGVIILGCVTVNIGG